MVARATLTRGGPHTSRPELPQDEALLALGQCQEEFVGLDALLAETEAYGALSSSSLCTAPDLPLGLLGKARGMLCYDVPLPFNFGL